MSSPDGLCSFPDCTELPTLDYLHCDACLGSLCLKHIYHPSLGHPCPTLQKDTWSASAKRVNTDRHMKLFKRLAVMAKYDAPFAAEDLRGVDCEVAFVPHFRRMEEWIDWSGSCHIHVPLTFVDGVQWLVRIRAEISEPCGNAEFALTSCDVATTMTAHELAPLFVPQVFIPQDQDPTSLSFCFVERIDGATGSPFESSTWRGTVKDVATLLVQLSAKSFKGIGSLCFDSSGAIIVGPLHNRHFFHYRAAHLKTYRTSAESKLARLDHLMQLVREKKLHWDARWHPTGGEYDPVWAYIMFLEARDIIKASEEMNAEQPTFLRHGDDHVGQLLRKEDGGIAGLIDWEYSSTVPFAEAFNAPTWLYDQDVLYRETTREDRNNELTTPEEVLCQELLDLDREDLANAVRSGRKWHRLEDLLGGNPPEYEGAIGLLLAFDPEAHIPPSKEEWIQEGMVKYADDDGLKVIIHSWIKEKKKEWEREAVATRADDKESHHLPLPGPFGDILGPGLAEKPLVEG